MKTRIIRITRSTVLLFLLLAEITLSNAQTKNPMNILSIEKTVEEFHDIYIESNFNVFLFEGIAQKVIIETEEKQLNNLVTNVIDDCLNIFPYHKIKESRINNVFITVTDLKKITIIGNCNIKFFYRVKNLDVCVETKSSSANLFLNSSIFDCNVYGKGKLSLNGNYSELNISLYESSTVSMDINTDLMTCKAFDMAEAKFSGLCNDLYLHIHDEASISSSNLVSKKCHIAITDSGEAYVSVSEKLEIVGEQDGFVEYRGDPILNIIAPKSVNIKHKKEKMLVND